MGELIPVIFGRDGGRCDQVHPCDIQRARQLYVNASTIDCDKSKEHIAVQMYEEALKIDPEFTEALSNLALIRYKNGDLAAARDMWLEALNFQGKDPIVALIEFNLGTTLYKLGDMDGALTHLTNSVKRVPSALTHFNIAALCEKVFLFETASFHWREVLRLDPKHPDRTWIKKRLLGCNPGRDMI